MTIRAVDFVMLPVTDLARSAAFYREILGLAPGVYSEPHQWAEFDCGNVTVSLKGNSSAAEVAGGARLALAVPDIHNAYCELRTKGVALEPPQDHGVCQHLEVHDPDGRLIILHQRADGTAG